MPAANPPSSPTEIQASSVVDIRDCGHYWHVTVNNPPVNATSTAVRQGLYDAVRASTPNDGNGDGKIAVVLSCVGRSFIAGGDITEFDAPPQLPHLPDICNMIEASALPWVAVMHGHVLGGGLEIAMSCAYRIADAKTKFGMTEVKVGLIPGAGGSQRLPRLVGVEAAIPMLTTGAMISAERFYALGGLDRVIEHMDGMAAAEEFLTALPPRPVAISARDVASIDPHIISNAEAKLTAASKGEMAALHNLSAITLAITTDFKDGQPEERKRHLALRDSAESRALRHAFLAERHVSRPSMIKGAQPKDLAKIAVVGGGLMGAGIAFSAMMAGYDIRLIERDQHAVDGARHRIQGMIDGAITRGKLTQDRADAMMAGAVLSTDYSAARDADLAIEAVFEDLEVKRGVFNALADVMHDDAILATNTSYLDPHHIMAGIGCPERLLGLHFFSPAHIMKLVEVITLDSTDQDVLATGFAFAKSLGKTGVLSRVCDGFIGNRILAAYRRQADYMLMDGATPAQIDRAMRSFGLNMGPYEMQDMAGLQIAWANRKRLAPTRPPEERYIDIGDKLCEAERFGQRSGAGWYRYEDNARQPIEDDVVTDLITKAAADAGITRHDFSDDDIQLRLLAVMANEGALIVDEGIAERDLDVDMVKMMGYGFPRWRGGPMHAAGEIGWGNIANAMAKVDAQSPNSWTIAPRLRDAK